VWHGVIFGKGSSNPKHQASKSKQIPIPKNKIQKIFVLDSIDLEFVWIMEIDTWYFFGIWCLEHGI
jgi:hypothetical protein